MPCSPLASIRRSSAAMLVNFLVIGWRLSSRAASSTACHAALRVSCAAPITGGRARFASEASASAQPTERAEPDGLGSFRARLASGPGFDAFVKGAPKKTKSVAEELIAEQNNITAVRIQIIFRRHGRIRIIFGRNYRMIFVGKL